MTFHRQVQIEVRGQRFEVDKELAALVTALGERGFQTFASCEDQPGTNGMAWIAFRSEYQAQRFCDLVGGTLIQPNAEEIANAAPDDPGHQGGIGVAFPNKTLSDVVARVEAI